MIAQALLFAACLMACQAAVHRFLAVHQDAERLGKLSLIDSNTGNLVKTSSCGVTFGWPSVEMTADAGSGKVFVVVFPDASGKSELHLLNGELEVQASWTNTSYWLFDLQYAPKQDALYGIKVVSTYGRVISNFTAVIGEDSVGSTELFAMPYMWYVNATSFDTAGNRYFALGNNFADLPFAYAQKIVTCDLSKDIAVAQPDCKVIDVSNSSGTIQFIGYSGKTSSLYFAGYQGDQVHVGILDSNTGKIVRNLFTIKAAAVGPLVVEDSADRLSVFIRSTAQGAWDLWHINSYGQANKVMDYSNTKAFAVFDAAAPY